jgi:hypothetical protein
MLDLEHNNNEEFKNYCDAMGENFQHCVLVLEHQTSRHYRVRIRLWNSESGEPIR